MDTHKSSFVPLPINPLPGNCTSMNGCGDDRLPTDSIKPELMSLAMGFVPYQAWETPYEADVALSRGTIFPSLDKPFIGEEAVPR